MLLALVLLGFAHGAVLSNTKLPRDTSGAPLITGETSVVMVNGTYYFYGECAPAASHMSLRLTSCGAP